MFLISYSLSSLSLSALILLDPHYHLLYPTSQICLEARVRIQLIPAVKCAGCQRSQRFRERAREKWSEIIKQKSTVHCVVERRCWFYMFYSFEELLIAQSLDCSWVYKLLHCCNLRPLPSIYVLELHDLLMCTHWEDIMFSQNFTISHIWATAVAPPNDRNVEMCIFRCVKSLYFPTSLFHHLLQLWKSWSTIILHKTRVVYLSKCS